MLNHLMALTVGQGIGLTMEVMAKSQVGSADQTVNRWHDVSLCESCQPFHHHLQTISPKMKKPKATKKNNSTTNH